MKIPKNLSVNRTIVVLINILVFVAAFHAVDVAMVEDEMEVDDESITPNEALLPHVTLTDEMKVGMFFDNLRIDNSAIKPEHIVQSISPWDPYIQRYSRQYSIDPDLVSAILYTESKGDPFSVSRDGALGLMQIMPTTADFLGIGNVFDPEENIKGGVKYIAWLVKNYDEEHLLWAWNAGPSMLEKNIIPPETRDFIVKVLSIKMFLKDEKNKTI